VTIIKLVLTSLPPSKNDKLAQSARNALFDKVGDIGRMAMNLVDQMNMFDSMNKTTRAQEIIKDVMNSKRSDKLAILTSNGDEAISGHDYNVAIEFYRQALLIDPLNVRSWIQFAKSHYQLDDHEQTIYYCYHALRLDSMNDNFLGVYCHILLGMSLAELEMINAALIQIETAIQIFHSIEINKSEVASHVSKGCLRLWNLCNAFSEYMKSRNEPELLGCVYEEMGISYESLFELQRALEWFQKALGVYQITNTNIAQIDRLNEKIGCIEHKLISDIYSN
jgi:tetratricopeptide (TPR) repeat protein